MSEGGPPLRVVILAAGLARRANAAVADPLSPVFFRPMIEYALEAVSALERRATIVVIGGGERELREHLRDRPDVVFVRRDAPGGTADALEAAEEHLRGQEGDVVALAANAVLVDAAALKALLARHRASGAACTVLAAESRDPEGAPRVLARADGAVELREEAECSDEERRVREVAGGAWAFKLGPLLDALPRLRPRGAGLERRLTDLPAALADRGQRTERCRAADPAEVLVVGDLYERWRVEAVLRERYNRRLMRAGVALQDPADTLIDPRCRIERGVLVEAGVLLVNSSLETGVKVESHARVFDCELGHGAYVKQGSILEMARVGKGCVIGPYAHLRPGTALGDDVRVGSFVEASNAVFGAGSKAGHLSCIADAVVGRGVTIGAGFITSAAKASRERTVIEDDVFIGEASQAIAPVTIGKGSFVATATSVVEDVPAGAFAISRGRQVVKPGYAKRA